jgi:hypothetical protein
MNVGVVTWDYFQHVAHIGFNGGGGCYKVVQPIHFTLMAVTGKAYSMNSFNIVFKLIFQNKNLDAVSFVNGSVLIKFLNRITYTQKEIITFHRIRGIVYSNPYETRGLNAVLPVVL